MVLEGRGLEEYLGGVLEVDSSSISLERITSNRTNIIHVCRAAGNEVVVKQYLDHVVKIPSVSMSPKRSFYERDSMLLFQAVLGIGFVPQVLHCVEGVLVMSYECSEFSLEGERNYELLSREHYRKIGSTLGRLHENTRGKVGVLSHSVSDFTDYNLLRTGAAECIFPDEVASFRSDLSDIDGCLVWADCCPKNMLVTGNDVCFIDLEFAHYGNPAIDLGFFTAHVVLYGLKHPEYKLRLQTGVDVFVEAYRAETGFSDIDDIVRLSQIYSGIILLHKTRSVGRYASYSAQEKSALELSEVLIKR